MNLTHLDSQAVGLDLTDSEDRAIFRAKVQAVTTVTRLSAINEWINANYRNRYEAVRALADQYIKQTIVQQWPKPYTNLTAKWKV